MLIAPTDFEGATPPDVPLDVVLGTCDGDVWNLAGAGYYDRARLGARVAPISQTLVRGANRNWFSTTWSPGHPWSFDDATNVRGCTGSAVPAGRPTPARQQAVLGQLATAFFRRHLAAGPASPLLGDRGLATRIARRPGGDVPMTRPRRVAWTSTGPRSATVSAFGTGIRAQGLTLGHRRLKTPAIGQAPPHGWSPHDLASARSGGAPGTAASRTGSDPGDPRDAGAVAPARGRHVESAGPAVVDIDLRDRAGRRRTVRIRLSAERPSSGAYRKAVLLGTVRVRLARWRGLDLGHLTALVLRPAGRHGAVLLGDRRFTRTI